MRLDPRQALRRLVANPGVTAVAVGTLALGIGANTAMFSVVHAVLLAPLPYQDPAGLVRIVGVHTDDGTPGNLSPADFFDFADGTRTLARMGAHGSLGSATARGFDGEAERVGLVRVTEGFFPTLGVQPVLGRLFTPEEDRPNGPAAVLLSHGYWQRRFAGARDVIGSTVQVDARPYTVVGVLPDAYRHLEENPDLAADIFQPWAFERAGTNRGGHFIRAVGRLAPGASVAEAAAELETIAARLERDHPDSNHALSVTVSPLRDALVSNVRWSLLVLTAAVALVLLVACANLANLLLAAGTGRRREFAVRTALGASRRQLVGQLLGESLVLSVLGTAAGVALAAWATRAAAVLAAASIPRADGVGIDGTVLAFSATVAVVAAVLSGLAPALHLSTPGLQGALKEGGRSAGAAMPRRARDLFMAAQVALALVLLVGAALLARSVWNLQRVPPGFAAGQLAAMNVALPTAVYPEGSQVPFYQGLEERVRALPGVQRVGAVNILPLSDNYDGRGIQVEDHPAPEGQAPSPQARSVTPGYFAAMGVPLVRGRLFDARDTDASRLVVVISESMARQLWPGQDPVGRRITFNSGIPREAQQAVGGPGSREVVGIVGDVRHLQLDEAAVPMFYTPHSQQPSYHTMTLVVRAAVDASSLAGAVRAQVHEMDPGVPVYQVRTGQDVLARAVAQPRIRAGLLAFFALLAAGLAALGVYGVIGYLVEQRSPEIGIRMALGAGRREVIALLAAEGLRPVAAGIVAGLVGAWALSRVLSSLLFGVGRVDAASYAGAAMLLLAAAVVATLVPARRALAIDPAQALRGE